jgi:hypothetical protein
MRLAEVAFQLWNATFGASCNMILHYVASHGHGLSGGPGFGSGSGGPGGVGHVHGSSAGT